LPTSSTDTVAKTVSKTRLQTSRVRANTFSTYLRLCPTPARSNVLRSLNTWISRAWLLETYANAANWPRPYSNTSLVPPGQFDVDAGRSV
jgi:hypothetical protein